MRQKKSQRPQHPQLTPEEAREIIQGFQTGATSDERSAEAQAAIWQRVQMKLLPRPWRGEGQPPKDWCARSRRVSELHSRADAESKREEERLVREIVGEATEEVKAIIARGDDLWK